MIRFPLRFRPGPSRRSRGRSGQPARIATNALGAAVVLVGTWFPLRFYLTTHRLIGAVFVAQQIWVAVAFLLRRPPSAVSRRLIDWGAAFVGSFGGFLLRPIGAHPGWGLTAGLVLQLLGLGFWAISFYVLGRSFGLVPADRGLVTNGPYALVRHPLYASYLLAQVGYLVQSISLWNAAVLVLTWGCQIVRSLAEERLLMQADPLAYRRYRARVRWRLVPGLW